jgi:hypothetical protein
VLPFNEATLKLLRIYDNLICVVFLFDFTLRMRRGPVNATTSSEAEAGSTPSDRSQALAQA